MPFTLEQFIPAHSLRIIRVQNLAPSSVLAFTHIRPALELRHNAFQIELANFLKQSFTLLFDVIRLHQRLIPANVIQQAPKCGFSVEQLLSAQILTPLLDQIKCDECNLTTAE